MTNKKYYGDSHSMRGIIGASHNNGEAREENDFYATDPIAGEWLCKLENLNHHIWECACGEGHLGKVFEKNGHDVLATDLINRGYGRGGGRLPKDRYLMGWRYSDKSTIQISKRVH